MHLRLLFISLKAIVTIDELCEANLTYYQL